MVASEGFELRSDGEVRGLVASRVCQMQANKTHRGWTWLFAQKKRCTRTMWTIKTSSASCIFKPLGSGFV